MCQTETTLEQLTAERSQLTAQAAQHQQRLNALTEALAVQQQQQQALAAQTPLAPLRQRLSALADLRPTRQQLFTLASLNRQTRERLARQQAEHAERQTQLAGLQHQLENARQQFKQHKVQLQEVERIHELENASSVWKRSVPCCRTAPPARCAAPPATRRWSNIRRCNLQRRNNAWLRCAPSQRNCKPGHRAAHPL